GGAWAGVGLPYVAPPFAAIFGSGAARIIGIITWVLMAVSFQPTLRFYRLSPLWGIALPAIALQYMLFTLDSAYQYVRGRGGSWKGRAPTNAAATRRSLLPRHDRARATGTRTFPWRRGSFIRATARRSSPSTNSCAPPTISPTMPR